MVPDPVNAGTHTADDQVMAGSPANRRRRSWIPWILVGVALLFAGLRTQFRIVVVKGESMAPTLRPGELLLVSTRAYRDLSPVRGDVVIVQFRGELIVKRVVGLPGEQVGASNGRVYVNGNALMEQCYQTLPGCLQIRPGRLIDNSYAVLGDNRSLPSTVLVHAVVPRQEIIGKVVKSFRLWPS